MVAGVYFFGLRKERFFSIRREPALDDRQNDNPRADLAADGEETQAGGISDLDDCDWLDFESLVKEAAPGRSPIKTQTPQPKQESKSTAQKSKMQPGASVLLEGDLVVLHAFAREASVIDGSALYALLEEYSFSLGPRDVFCRRDAGEACIVANAFKPGIFPDSPEDFETRGVSMILQLSLTSKPLVMFDDLLTFAHALQERLNCRLYDAQRSSLTGQTVTYLHDAIKEYEFRHSI